MKAIAKDIVVQNYNIVVTDEQVMREQERNKEKGTCVSDDKVRKAIIRQRVIELIGDEKRKSSFFIYEGTVRCSPLLKFSLFDYFISSVIGIMETFPTKR